MVRVAPRENPHVQANTGVQGDGFKNVTGQRTREVSANEVVFLARRLAAVYQVRTSRNIHYRVGQGFVQGNGCLAEATDSGLVAQRCPQDLAEGDCHVLHRVVGVDVGIPVALTVMSISECLHSAVNMWS